MSSPAYAAPVPPLQARRKRDWGRVVRLFEIPT